jgi:hypothetical protein
VTARFDCCLPTVLTPTREFTADNGLRMKGWDDRLLAHIAKPISHWGHGEDCTLFSAPFYLSGCTNPSTAAAAATQPRLGLLAQPGNSIHLQAHNYHRWAIDNGAFGKARRGTPWTERDTEEYLAYLARVVREVDTSNCLFATAPDVLQFVDGKPMGDAEESWERGRKIFARIRALGLPVALVAQDGIAELMRGRDWKFFDVLFLGGSDQFKLGWEAEAITHEANLFGKWVHMGRVNSLKRFKRAKEIGCQSGDGTFIGFGPKTNTPIVLNWLEETTPRHVIPPIATPNLVPVAA